MIRFGVISFLAIVIIAASSNASLVPQKEAALPPYQGAPPAIQLTPAHKEQLANGKPIYFPVVDNKDGGSAIAVFKVHAPAEFIWKVISSFEQYPSWVDGVKKTNYYKPLDGDHVYVQFTVGKFYTPSYTYHIIHNFPKLKTGWGTWSLDASLPNDLINCRGFWRVTSTTENPNQSIVEYSVELKGKGFMMELVRPILLKNGAENATSWVSKQAEAVFKEASAPVPI